MITNKINEKGFVSVGPVDGTNTLSITGVGTSSFNQPVSLSNGIINFPVVPRHQIFQLANQSFTGSVHGRLRVSASLSTHNHNLLENIWDFINHKFVFPIEHGIYTIRLDGIIPTAGVTGDPIFHIDFEVSGVISTTSSAGHANETVHRQTVDTVVRSQGPTSPNHVHFHAVYIIHTDAQIVASGAQLYVATSGPALQFASGTMLIKEG